MGRAKLEAKMKIDPDILLPHESEGICTKCKVFAVLGNQYCSNCWDKTTSAARNIPELK